MILINISDREKRQWFRQQLQRWAEGNSRDFPWRQRKDPYALLVAEILLQQTEATRVVPVYQQFMERYPSLESLASAPLEEISRLLYPLGFHFRAARLRQAAELIRTRYGGRVPQSEAELLKLPGVGKYTAGSLCAHAFGQPVAVLDTNVARILERFFGLQGGRIKSRDRMLSRAAQLVAPKTEVSRWNLTLLDFGATVCTASHPRCEDCPLRQRCEDFTQRSGMTAF